MYAVIGSGGKQYRVKAGDVVRVEKLEKDVGSEFDWTKVLFVGGKDLFVDESSLSKAKVIVLVTGQSKSSKVLVFKKKRRQGYKRMRGHRQSYTELLVKEVVAPNGESCGIESPEKVAKKATKKVVKKATKKAAKKKLDEKKVVENKAAEKKVVENKAAEKKVVENKAAEKDSEKN